VGRLLALIAKEARELARERTVLFGLIIMPFILFSLMGVAVSQSIEQVRKAAEAPVALAVAAEPGAGPGDRRLASLLASAVNGTLVDYADPGELLASGYDGVVVVPPGAWDNLTSGRPALVKLYVKVGGISFVSQARAAAVESLVVEAGRALLASLISQQVPVTPQALARPLSPETTYYLRGAPLDPASFNALSSTLVFTAMVFLVMVIGGVQVAATSMGLEREAKTLEMLLSAPLTHREIVLGRIVGVALVTLAGLASYAAGLAVYMQSLRGAAEEIGAFKPEALAYVAPSLAATLYTTAALGLLIGMTAQDVRGAQLVGAQTAFILALPYFASFVGLTPQPGDPAYAALLADPLYPPLAAAVAGLLGDAKSLAAAYAASAAHAAAWTIAASRLMSPERLLLGFNLRRLRAQRVRA